jgi:hypothetical protein
MDWCRPYLPALVTNSTFVLFKKIFPFDLIGQKRSRETTVSLREGQTQVVTYITHDAFRFGSFVSGFEGHFA